MSVKILEGDVRAMLATLPPGSVQCVVTSPPYWGLRDYGVPGQLGLEPSPEEHVATMVEVFRAVKRVLRADGVCWVNYGDSYATSVNGRSAADTKAAGNDDRTFRDKPFGTVGGVNKPKDLCMVPFRFAEAMKADGWWLRSILPWVKRNSMPESVSDRPATAIEYVFLFSKSQRYFYDADAVMRRLADASVDRLAQDIDSHAGSDRANGGRKTNGPMKAVRGRDTYGLQTLGKYLPEGERRSNSKYDHDTNGSDRRLSGANPGSTLAAVTRNKDKQRGHSRRHAGFNDRWDGLPREEQVGARNFRNSDLFFDSLAPGFDEGPLGLISDADGTPLALDVPPQPYREAHFATFPPKLIEPLIRAGTSEKGCCPHCRAPWVRIAERALVPTPGVSFGSVADARDDATSDDQGSNRSRDGHVPGMATSVRTLGFEPGCRCVEHQPVPCAVLDPFGGSGTTGLVADRLGRDAILIELNPEYAALARRRIGGDAPLLTEVA